MCSPQVSRMCESNHHVLRVLTEKRRELNNLLYLVLVDLRRANDSVNCEALLEVLEKKHLLPSMLASILRAFNKGTKRAMRTYGNVTGGFDITTGVRQGMCWHHAVMFNFFFDAVIAATMSTHLSASVRMSYSLTGTLLSSRRKKREEVSVSDLEYADDTALISASMNGLEEALRMLNVFCVVMSLTINARKTKVLSVRHVYTVHFLDQCSCKFGKHVDVGEEFEYFSSTIIQNCSLDHEIDRK